MCSEARDMSKDKATCTSMKTLPTAKAAICPTTRRAYPVAYPCMPHQEVDEAKRRLPPRVTQPGVANTINTLGREIAEQAGGDAWRRDGKQEQRGRSA